MANLIFGGNRHPDEFARLGMAQRYFLRLDLNGTCIDRAGHELAAGRFENELRATAARPIRDPDVAAAFETVARFAAQSERLAGAPDVRRLEVSALDQHVLRGVVNLRVQPAHHARQRDAVLLVGDEQGLGGQRAFLSVERLELLALRRAAHDDGGHVAADVRRRSGRSVRLVTSAATGEQVIIERVQRLADFEHHVVRDIHDIVDAADADLL